ncbi:TRM13 [[Candida] subhashii]|uniref:tRNA:m(4)X modification enzyme TRM13 n=1 Tax=[Candida] subhashii TaxID=561895 RepID=A0A8J5QKC7_9ASCO|nr:TRM13 [[Candida] subhashii]KAG7662257.1 TRM13 [[Candida] subhashii]
MSETKKRKIEEKKPHVEKLQCEYFLAKKNRRCAMQRKKDQRFCSEHMIHEDNKQTKQERVPCPLDPNHTVWVKELEKHLKKCNAKPKEIPDPWFEMDLNVTLKGISETVEKVESEDDGLDEVALFAKYIPILKSISFEPLQFKISEHKGLDERLEIASRQKHSIQQSSLIGNLKSRNLLSSENFYVEFGCGKGELSRFINLCILQDSTNQNKLQKNDCEKYGYGFIDRGVNRLKVDKRIINDCSDSELKPIIKRTRIDIKDLNLDKFVEDVNPNRIVGISKHLCGAATDLTLKSLVNSTILKSEKFGGLLIAMCCRHACAYDQLLPQSRQYLYDRGFKTLQSFNILKKMVSWAVSSSRPANSAEQQHISGLTFEERAEVGLLARRLIDESRVIAMKLMVGEKLDIDMFWYVQKDITLENVCLAITPAVPAIE